MFLILNPGFLSQACQKHSMHFQLLRRMPRLYLQQVSIYTVGYVLSKPDYIIGRLLLHSLEALSLRLKAIDVKYLLNSSAITLLSFMMEPLIMNEDFSFVLLLPLSSLIRSQVFLLLPLH